MQVREVETQNPAKLSRGNCLSEATRPLKSELVYCSSISLQDVINSVAKKTLARMPSEDKSSNSQGQNDVILCHATQISLRSSIRNESSGIARIQSVDVEDISVCKEFSA